MASEVYFAQLSPRVNHLAEAREREVESVPTLRSIQVLQQTLASNRDHRGIVNVGDGSAWELDPNWREEDDVDWYNRIQDEAKKDIESRRDDIEKGQPEMQRLERDGSQKSEITSSEIQKSEIKKGYEPIEMAEEDGVSWLDAYVEEEENDLIGWVDYVDWYTTERAHNPDLQVHGTSDDVAMIGGVTRIQKSEVTNQECREGFDHWMKSKELEEKEKSAILRAEVENSEVSLDVKLGDDTSPCGAGVMSAGVRKSGAIPRSWRT